MGNYYGLFDYISLNLFLKAIFKLKNIKMLLKTSFGKHNQEVSVLFFFFFLKKEKEKTNENNFYLCFKNYVDFFFK